MKKFLTVLLVIAVMFTFSFGTAFAAVDPGTPGTGSQKTLDEAYASAKTELGAIKNSVVEKLADEYVEVIGCGDATHQAAGGIHEGTANTFNLTIAKAVYKQIAENIYSDYMEVLAIRYAQLSAGDEADKTAAKLALTIGSDAKYGDLADLAYSDVNTEAKFKALLISSGAQKPYLNTTLKLALNDYRETVKTELSKIDVSLYTADVMDEDDPYAVTYNQLAEKTKAEWIADAADVSVSADATINTVIAALCQLNKMVASNKIVGDVTYVNAKGETVNVTYKFADNAVKGYNDTPLVTKTALEASGTTKDAAIASKKALITSNAAAYYNAVVTTLDKSIWKTAKDNADAYVEVLTNRVENATDPSAVVIPACGESSVAEGLKWTEIKAKYDKLVDDAAALKVMVDATGKLLYDAAKIDANLVKAKAEVYDGDPVYTYDLTQNARNVADDVEWTKAKAIAAAEDERDGKLYQADGTANYYEPEQAKIVAKYDELIAKINAATTSDQVDAISKVVSLAGIKDKKGVNTAVKGLSKFETEYTKLQNYVNYLNGDTKEWQEGYKAMMSKDDLAEFYAENGARTNEEIVALIDKAKAECDAIKSTKELKEAKKAVEDQVAALPAYITVAEKEAVKAAWTVADDLGVAIDNQAKLDNAVTQLKNAEDAAIDKMVKALPAKNNVTTANKEAVKAIADAVDAYESETMYKTGDNFAVYDQKALVNEYKALVRDAAKAEVVAAIAALPENASKAQIEAARAAYDAFVAEYQDALKGYDAKNEIVNLEKLTYAEAQLVANAEENAKAYVQDLKVAARSTKTSKGVKVTINADVQPLLDAGFTVEYKFYRSTKSNKNFGTAKVTKTENTYLNTAGKKGTKYYYKAKLVVKNAAGEVVATTPLTQCLYATRTF